MIVLIIIGYIASVFYSRWVNYLLYKMDNDSPILVFIWFSPIVNVIAWSTIYLMEINKGKGKHTWFTGKNW